jgi:6-phosphogluconolactonase
MNLRRIAALTLLAAGAASISFAQDSTGGFVYTMTNATQNTILVFQRSGDGTLSSDTTVPTGGNGTGSNFGSNGALALSAEGRWLFAANAGSNSVSVFEQRSTGLQLTFIIASGGNFPESIAVSGDLVYVLNGGAPANVTGFFFDADNGTLIPIANSTRPLSAPSPGTPQVGFDNTGTLLFVTEKATNLIDAFEIQEDGTPDGPHFQNSNGQTPFGFSFDSSNHLIVSEAFGGQANKSAVSSYEVSQDATLQTISGSVPTEQTAACWLVITRNSKFAYTSDTGSGAITGYRISGDGKLSILNANGITAPTGGPHSAPVDLALTHNGRFLYGINVGSGTLLGWRVQADGQLSFLGQVEPIPTSATGLVAR